MSTAQMNGTERTLVVARYRTLAGYVLVQVAYRDPAEAARDAAKLAKQFGVTEVTVDTVPNYRGRRVTRVAYSEKVSSAP